MKKVVAVPAPEPRSDLYKQLAWVYAAVLVAMAVGQLFAFENFIPLMKTYLLPGGLGTASLVGCLVVMMEVLSVPYLLRMNLSPLMRWTGLVFSVSVPIVWALVSVFALLNDIHLLNGGILGTKVHVPVVLQLGLAAILLVFALAVAYGLFPRKRK